MEATAITLTPEAITKLLTCDRGEMLQTKPVVQVIRISEKYEFVLSDGLKSVQVYSITDKVHKLVRSKQLRKGSIVQLTKFFFGFDSISGRPVTVKALNVIRSKCDIIGNPEPFYNRIITYFSSVNDSDDDSEPDQNEDCRAPTQKCSCSQIQSNKKRKLESSEAIAKDISKIVETLIERNKENDMDDCFEKLEKIGWGTEDPMYDTAILLFGESADYRLVLLHLKPESCGKWVKNAGSKFGLLG